MSYPKDSRENQRKNENNYKNIFYGKNLVGSESDKKDILIDPKKNAGSVLNEKEGEKNILTTITTDTILTSDEEDEDYIVEEGMEEDDEFYAEEYEVESDWNAEDIAIPDAYYETENHDMEEEEEEEEEILEKEEELEEITDIREKEVSEESITTKQTMSSISKINDMVHDSHSRYNLRNNRQVVVEAKEIEPVEEEMEEEAEEIEETEEVHITNDIEYQEYKEYEEGRKEVESNDDVVCDVLNRIESIYYKESKYKSLKDINNNNNSVDVSDLNLSIISDYLNVDISAFHKKCNILLIGNSQSGKSSFINWFSETYVQNTNIIQKNNKLTYVDIKNNFKFNLKRFNDEKYQLGLLNKRQNNMEEECEKKNELMNNPPSNKNLIFSGEHCDYLFRPFGKLRKKIRNAKKYIYGKVCMQNNFTKYMNRVNSVSFIDSTGIDETDDKEYDNLLLNLSKYVDLIFIFIDSNNYTISERLRRVINYIMDYQIKKVTICLTRIDLIQRLHLYRVIFFLTQYFLQNLNIFRMDILYSEDQEEAEVDEETQQFYEQTTIMNESEKGSSIICKGTDRRVSKKRKERDSKTKMNKAISTLRSVMRFPKLVHQVIRSSNSFHYDKNRNNSGNVNREDGILFEEEVTVENNSFKTEENNEHTTQNRLRTNPRGFTSTRVSIKQIEMLEEEEEEEEEENNEGGGGILKKIMTKRFSSFKEKLLPNDLMSKLNAGNEPDDDSEVLEESCEHELETSKYPTTNHIKNNKELFKFAQRRKSIHGCEALENSLQNSEEVVGAIKCSNDSTLPKNLKKTKYKNTKRTREKGNTQYQISYTDIIKNVCVFLLVLFYGILVSIFRTLCSYIQSYFYEDEKPRIVEDEEVEEMEKKKKKQQEQILRRQQANFNSHKILEFLTIYLPDIPCNTLKLEKWVYDEANLNRRRRNRFSCNMNHNQREWNEKTTPTIPLNKTNFQRRSIPLNFFLEERNDANRVPVPAKTVEIKKPSRKEKSNLDLTNSTTHTNRPSGFSDLNQITRDSYMTNKNRANRNMSVHTENNELPQPFQLRNKKAPDLTLLQEPPTMHFNNSKYKQEDLSGVNMIQELLFKIDESIDIKTNESIYMLKEDLQKIQNNCMKKLLVNDAIVKKNKSVRIEKIKFFFFKFTTIIIGFFISLLRYDLLVYFNFINSELLFSLFSKYFIFLSSYNKNSLFIMANVFLILGYSFLYFRYKKRDYFKSMDKSDLNKIKIILLFTQIIFDEINQLQMKLLGKEPNKTIQ